MSDPIFPNAVWSPGTMQNATPANTNSLRDEARSRLVISKATTAQPGSPADGDVYIIPAGATGAQWAGFTEHDLAIYRSGTWYAYAPVAGLVINLAGAFEQFEVGTGWTAIGGAGGDVIVPICVPVSDETTALTTGVGKVTFRMPYAMTLTAVRSSAGVAPTGAALILDINANGSTILSTKLSIDAGEKTSTTAATPPVISDTTLDDDAEITIDIDQVGSTIAGAGAKVWLIGYKTP